MHTVDSKHALGFDRYRLFESRIRLSREDHTGFGAKVPFTVQGEGRS